MSLEVLEETQRAAREVLESVETAQMVEPTPCGEWNVAQLINHLVSTQYWFASTVTGEQVGESESDFAAGDYLSAFNEGAAKTIAAFRAPGVMEQKITVPWGEFTGAQFASFAAVETLAHAWDVAFATSQDTDLVPASATHLLDVVKKTMPAESRSESGGAFKPEKNAPAGAPVADHFAAFLGRIVD